MTGVLSAAVHIFNETAMLAKAQASNRMAKADRASHGPRVSLHTQARVRVKKTRESPKKNPKEPKVRTKVPKAYTKAKHRKLVSQVLKIRNWRQAHEHRNLHAFVPLIFPGTLSGVLTNGMVAGVLMNDWSSVGWHVGWGQTSASTFRLEVWMSVPPVV